MAYLYGLNTYKRVGFTDLACFSRFQTILPGKLVRSTQPNYTDGDLEHTLTKTDVDALKREKIACVISANHCVMKPEAKKLLVNAGIAFFHFKVVDGHAPNKHQLIKASSVIELFSRRGATLVYCGYGQGRTGTFVAAWAMIRYMAQRGANIDAMCNMGFLKHHFGVEEPAQVKAIREAAGLPEIAAMAPLITVGTSNPTLNPNPTLTSAPQLSGASMPASTSWPAPQFSGGSGLPPLPNFSSGSSWVPPLPITSGQIAGNSVLGSGPSSLGFPDDDNYGMPNF